MNCLLDKGVYAFSQMRVRLLSHTDDVDVNEKLNQWEQYYNFQWPHGALKGKAPYEVS